MPNLRRIVVPDAGDDPVAAQGSEQGRGDEPGCRLGHGDLDLGTFAAQIGHHLARFERRHAAADTDEHAVSVEGEGHCDPPVALERAAWMIASISWAARFGSSFTT